MKNRKIKINNVCIINSENISSTNPPDIIKYLDTGSITKNKIDNIQILNRNYQKFPSRAQRKVQNNTIIYSTVRPNLEHYGFLENPPENFIVSTGFLTIDVMDKEIDPKYLYYHITQKHLTEYLHTIATNNVSSYPSINPDDLGNIEILIPFDKTTQQRIASVLSSLNDKIELNNKINAELEQMAKTIYDYWFVQFDFPYDFDNGKPDINGKPYKSSGGKMIWNDDLKREIPEGWEVGILGNYSKVKSGFAFKSTDWKLEGIPVIKITNIKEDYSIDLKGCSFVSNDLFDNAKKFIGKPGDIAIAMTGATIGKFGIIPYNQNNIFINQRVGLFDLGESPIKKLPFLFNCLKQPYIRENVFSLSSGCAQPNISADQINKIKILIPPIKILNKYNENMFNNYLKIIKNKEENQSLTSLRDWLLPMLMNGQVKVE